MDQPYYPDYNLKRYIFRYEIYILVKQYKRQTKTFIYVCLVEETTNPLKWFWLSLLVETHIKRADSITEPNKKLLLVSI